MLKVDINKPSLLSVDCLCIVYIFVVIGNTEICTTVSCFSVYGISVRYSEVFKHTGLPKLVHGVQRCPLFIGVC